jgi:hypothetical protein
VLSVCQHAEIIEAVSGMCLAVGSSCPSGDNDGSHDVGEKLSPLVYKASASSYLLHHQTLNTIHNIPQHTSKYPRNNSQSSPPTTTTVQSTTMEKIKQTVEHVLGRDSNNNNTGTTQSGTTSTGAPHASHTGKILWLSFH